MGAPGQVRSGKPNHWSSTATLWPIYVAASQWLCVCMCAHTRNIYKPVSAQNYIKDYIILYK